MLNIQRAPQYGTYDARNRRCSLDQSFNVNDRMTDAFTLQTPAGTALTTGDSFSLYDGVTTRPTEFVLKGLTPTPGDIPIYYTGRETAAGIASLVNTAINSTAKSTGSTIYSAWNGTSNLTTTMPSNQVDLFEAQSATTNGGLNNDAPNFVLQTSDASFIDQPGGATSTCTPSPATRASPKPSAKRSSMPTRSAIRRTGASWSSQALAIRVPTPRTPARSARLPWTTIPWTRPTILWARSAA